MVNSSQTFARFLFRLVYHCGVPESSTNREGPTAGKEHSYRTKSSISSGCTRGAKSADRRILHICGCVLFAGVQAGAAPGALPPDVYRGWFCAWVTLMNTFSREVWHSKDFLAILSGWINPLILFYLVFLIRPRLVWTRRIMGGAIVAFMAATWIYFALVPMVPLIGHVLWIAGILMMLAGGAFGHEPLEFNAPGPAPQ